MATSSFLGLTTFWKRLAFSNFDDWILGTVLKVSVFGIILVRIFPHSEWITPNTDTFYAVGSLILSKNRQESGYDVKLLSTGIPTGLFFNLKLQRYQFFLEPKFHSSCSRVFLNSEYFRKVTCIRPLLKRESNIGDFLWILQNFQEHLFWKTSTNGCFWCYSCSLAHYSPVLLFWKSKGFLMFSGGIEKQHRAVMG